MAMASGLILSPGPGILKLITNSVNYGIWHATIGVFGEGVVLPLFIMALTFCSLMTVIHMGYVLITAKVKIWIDKNIVLFNKLSVLFFFISV